MREQNRMIMGKNCIFELLKTAPSRIIKVFCSQNSSEDALYNALVKSGITIKKSSKDELSLLVNSDSHQGYVALVEERQYIDVKQFIKNSEEKKRSIVLMVDSIFDPQNLGAIIRAGECFGVDLLLYSKNRGTEITPVVTKASAGATELLPIAKVSNLVETLKSFQKVGFWAVAAELKDGAHSLENFSFPEKVVLVLGSEGKGIQPLLSKSCDFHLMIPMFGKIDSLNVSQAAAVLLSHCRITTT